MLTCNLTYTAISRANRRLMAVNYTKGMEIMSQMINMIVGINIWPPIVPLVLAVNLLKLYPITPAYDRRCKPS